MKGLCNGNGFGEVETEFLCITYINFVAPIVKKCLIKHVSRTHLERHAERAENLLSTCTLFIDIVTDSDCTTSEE